MQEQVFVVDKSGRFGTYIVKGRQFSKAHGQKYELQPVKKTAPQFYRLILDASEILKASGAWLATIKGNQCDRYFSKDLDTCFFTKTKGSPDE